MYQCRAHNQLHAVFSSSQLRVLSMKPSFHKRPLESEIYAIYNGNTTIVCDPEAAPRPKFQWKKDEIVIGAGGHRRILPTGTLIISPTSRDDEGIYTCLATNAYGTSESKARLIVLRKWTEHERNHFAANFTNPSIYRGATIHTSAAATGLSQHLGFAVSALWCQLRWGVGRCLHLETQRSSYRRQRKRTIRKISPFELGRRLDVLCFDFLP